MDESTESQKNKMHQVYPASGNKFWNRRLTALLCTALSLMEVQILFKSCIIFLKADSTNDCMKYV